MQARNMHQFRSIVYFFIAIGNIVGSIFLVKHYGAIGGAIATGISFMIGNILIMNIYYHKRMDLNIILFWENILKMTIPILISMGVGVILNIYLVEVTYMRFLTKVIIYSGVYLIALFIIGLNEEEKKEIINILLKFNKKVTVRGN